MRSKRYLRAQLGKQAVCGKEEDMKKSEFIRFLLLPGVLASMVIASVGCSSNADEMLTAADDFISALSEDQRARAVFTFEDVERQRWHFIPPEMFPRAGVALKEMDPEQRDRAHDLIRSALSNSGYMTTIQIMELEDVLQALENGGRFARDSEEYVLSVFGTPSADTSWGWRFEGHHVSLHFTIIAGAVVASSPAFLGANPAEVLDGPDKGLRALADKEDAARTLLQALDAGQHEMAIISDVAPRDIVTGAELEINPLTPVGIGVTMLTEEQRLLLMDLIKAYTSVMAEEIADYRLDRLYEAGIDKIAFAWAGGVEPGEPHYYRVQGPTFLIEYDNTQNNANHIHSVWREFNGDFGRDLLREHVRTTPH